MLQPAASQSSLSLNLLEAGFTAIAIALAFAWPRIGARAFARAEQIFATLARRKPLAVAATGLAALLIRLALLPLFPVPLPVIPDDFSFLLACDTFLHGRLANPTPAMWTHFESIHIDMLPTYGSMYFPAQGLLLAAGKILFGHPWFGLAVMSAAMCAALCWMLQAWLPANWALLGGLTAVLRIALFSYWTNSYHAAGSIAALGGALVLGALPRFVRRPTTGCGLLMGLGIALLGISRPYEGMLLCLPVLMALLRGLAKSRRRPSALVLVRRAAPGVAVVLAAAAWLGYYNSRAFGSPLTLPYTVNRATYAVAPYFVWQPPRPEPSYRHEQLRRFYVEYELPYYQRLHSPSGFLSQTLGKALAGLLFFTGFALLPPLMMARRVLLDRRVSLLVGCSVVLVAGMFIENFILPHYLAPFTAVFYALGLQAARHLRLWSPGAKPVGMAITRLCVLICLLMAGLRTFDRQLHLEMHEWPVSEWNDAWYGPDHFGTERAAVETQLQQQPDGQLAIVRYSAQHDPGIEWVYNSADIDSSKVVWAREMGRADNLELIAHYADRKVWLVEPDASPARVSPYPMAALASPEPKSPGSGNR